MKNDIFEALALLENERGLSIEYMLDKIKKAIVTACKNNYNGNDDVLINIDEKKGKFEVYLHKVVVDEVMDPGREISLKKAREIEPGAEIDDIVSIKLDTKEFGRIAAQTARNIIRQGIRDGERSIMLKDFEDKLHKVVSAVVEKIDPVNGSASIKIGKFETFLPKNEQISACPLKEGDHVKVYVADVKESDRGPKAIVSRTHPEFVRKIFESEVPEIQDNIVQIKSISREAGSRTKMAVMSIDPNVDPIGACIGAKGARVSSVVEELGGEKIDIIEYSEDPIKFISAALAPAEVLSVNIENGESKSCKVIVPDSQLSLAIGNRGQNARLAARLTGFKIDIKPESQC